jgi:mono/diheme cytochrome c family protein
MVDKYPDARAQELVVALGRNAMAGFGDQLTPDEISAVVAYTRVALGRGDP